jgi:hypothetical protein
MKVNGMKRCTKSKTYLCRDLIVSSASPIFCQNTYRKSVLLKSLMIDYVSFNVVNFKLFQAAVPLNDHLRIRHKKPILAKGQVKFNRIQIRDIIGCHATKSALFPLGLLIFSTKLFPPDLNEQSEIICSTIEHANPQRAQNIIDKQISKHEKSIIALKTLRNTFSPISRLPTEILCHIFYFTQEQQRYFVLNWIKVTYISRQWRTVALNSPNLWTNLLFGPWTSIMLERSKKADLTVKFDFSNRTSNAIKYLESAFHHVDRFKVLLLENGHASLLRDLVSKLPKSAPRLHSLIISVYRSRVSELGFDHDSDTCDLPEAMLCETENVHYVELKGCNPSWNSHLFSSLLHLKIDGVSRAARPTTKQFLEMLKRMPNLESLELHNAIPVENSGSVQETILLSGLNSLSLSSSYTEIGNLLRYLIYPPTTRVKIVADATLISDLNFSGMFSRLSSILASSDKKRGCDIARLFIRGTDNTRQSVQIQAHSKLKPQSKNLFHHGLINPDIDLTFNFQEYAEPSKQFLDSVLPQCFHAFPLDNLSSLFLSDVTPSPQILLDLFGTLRHLESIVSTGTSAHPLVAALQGTPTLGQATSPVKTNFVFPGLRSLALGDATFEPDHYDSEFTCIHVDSLRDCLKQRHEHGAGLHELHLKDCYYLYLDDVNLFEEAVGLVHWDKVEQGLSDEESEEDDEDEMEFGIGYSDEYDDYEYDSDVDDGDYS